MRSVMFSSTATIDLGSTSKRGTKNSKPEGDGSAVKISQLAVWRLTNPQSNRWGTCFNGLFPSSRAM